ncbi:hypothetical protein [Acidomonas methanolica]|uniref:Uncharacterized protein n=1 Tax=Acidomonas methanolica NBRC 104435 TaxID=1231351 RepID=A0A023D8G1_ACIMT|nr:hypothetical protein [Acidomonas methanolica]TCS21157.1 hypothetical protein EDC31_1427 [Acidomonas methanolica]GAJ30384.1 hypothetical protein Amme_129_008 [Acidomonas methanolica NBRC 104435]GBQ50455.1 hypothetical protein AA0498_1213 [Acidomonas methanolica]GEL00491.1 hypothetical protein AME01nite_29890 [Acidomonas methanolica NBRC 104435]
MRLGLRRWGLMISAVMLALPGSMARAQDDEEKKPPSLHELAHQSNLPHAHANFRRYLYRPEGDKVIEQPEAERLIFRTPDGEPDGYAERRGPAIIYHDRSGKVIRVQPLEEDE